MKDSAAEAGAGAAPTRRNADRENLSHLELAEVRHGRFVDLRPTHLRVEGGGAGAVSVSVGVRVGDSGGGA